MGRRERRIMQLGKEGRKTILNIIRYTNRQSHTQVSWHMEVREQLVRIGSLQD